VGRRREGGAVGDIEVEDLLGNGRNASQKIEKSWQGN
jgi:hypothetical protein